VKGSNLLLTHEAFDKMIPRMLGPEMIEDTAKIANEALNDWYRVNLIINNRAGGNAPLIAQKISDSILSEKQKRHFCPLQLI
jgi:hypothetical protein